MNQLIEAVNEWSDKYLSNPIHDVDKSTYLIFLYQDFSFKNELIANVYYNTITSQYKVKSFNNQLNYCVDNMIEAIECIIVISEHYHMYGKSCLLLDNLKYYIMIEGYDYYKISDYDDDDDWLIGAINKL